MGALAELWGGTGAFLCSAACKSFLLVFCWSFSFLLFLILYFVHLRPGSIFLYKISQSTQDLGFFFFILLSLNNSLLQFFGVWMLFCPVTAFISPGFPVLL